MITIGVLTSSRADFGIYLPLLRKIKKDDAFHLRIIAFGTHLSHFYGNTVSEIRSAGFEVAYEIRSMVLTDTADSVASAMGLTMIRFADFWERHAADFDLVLCLGDRYEMFAAVTASIPFGVKLGHIHGGETTTGAIDNIFRHAITLSSGVHFVSTARHAERARQLIGTANAQVYNIGALSLDNITGLDFFSKEEFLRKWKIDLDLPTILLTFHPETVDPSLNLQHANEIVKMVRMQQAYQFLVTMPNADTNGTLIREVFESMRGFDNVHLVENLGSESYMSALKYVSMLIGNSSSGIIEAASFGKYVINTGNRQQGRDAGENVINVPVNAEIICEKIAFIEEAGYVYKQQNIYYNGGGAEKIIAAIKSMFHEGVR